jgi:hypothetical protein
MEIYLGDVVQCKQNFLRSTNTGELTDINYIPPSIVKGQFLGYSVELILKDDLNMNQKEYLTSCKLLTSEEKEKQQQKLEDIKNKTAFLTKQIATQYGFKIGDHIDCKDKKGNNISGIAKQFKYNLRKNKTYVIIENKDKKTETIGVKYCTNEYNHALQEINQIKEKEYMKKQFKKLKEIIKKINKLSPSDENYDFHLKNLNSEYIEIETQINKTIQLKIENSSSCNPSDPSCTASKASKSSIAASEKILTEESDERLKEIRQKRVMLLELLRKLKPDDYNSVNTILRRSSLSTSVGGNNSFQAILKPGLKPNIPINKNLINTMSKIRNVKGGNNTFGMTPKYMQRAGHPIYSLNNPEENINNIINNSNNLLNIMDKTLL